MSSPGYTIAELLTVVTARELRDGEVGFVGIGTGGEAFILAVGIPAAAMRLAQLTHAPNFVPMFGPIIDADLRRIPKSMAEHDLIYWPSKCQIPLDDALDMFKRGKIDVGFISGTQIDRYGNINIVAIGDYRRPKVRLVGCLAQTDHCAHAGRTISIIKHAKRTLVEKVDFISGVGFLDGSPDARKRAGLRGGGPAKLITTLCVMGFHPETHEMQVESVHPGVSVDDVRANTGFDVQVAPDLRDTVPPTEEELKLIREVIDPKGMLLRALWTGQEATIGV
jgi:glutaconate CoA-transferase subunit B